MSDSEKDLPHPLFVARARQWLLQGAPAVPKDLSAHEAVQTLRELLDALPKHIPLYCWGSKEHHHAMLHPRLHPRSVVDAQRRELEERRARRPADYADLSPREQWSIDKDLGLLDDDGR
jgi:hypothetical protein